MKSSKRKPKTDEKRWSEAAKSFEDKSSLDLLALSTPVSPEEHRQILGAGERKPISIRIPENDLAEIQRIAKANGRKYQQLIVLAVELYIDNYHRMVDKEKPSKKLKKGA